MIRRAIVALIFCLAPSSVGYAQQWADKMFVATSHDFGKVPRASKQEFRFKFKNLYKEDVHVAGVRVSCHCVSATVENPDLKTFETGEIVVDFNTRAFLGQRSATVTVTFDKPYYAETRLHIEGYIRSDVVFDPPLADLGTVDLGTSVERKIAVHYAGRSDWEITDVTSPNKSFEVQVSKPKRSTGGVDYELSVRLKDDAPVGYIREQLTLVTNDRNGARIPLYVEGRVASEVQVSPASLYFGDVPAGKEASKTLIVRGKKPFRIAAIESDAPQCFKFALDETEATLHKVRVTFTAGDKPGKVMQTLRVKTAAGKPAVAQCQASARIVAVETTKPKEAEEKPVSPQ